MICVFGFLEVSGFGLVTRIEEEEMGMELKGIFICVSVGIQCGFALQLDNHMGIVNSVYYYNSLFWFLLTCKAFTDD